LEQCETECDAEDARCEGSSRQSCGNYDDDLCLEWSSPEPCGPGMGCDEIDGSCIPSCIEHEECEHPLVGTRCVEGNCEVISECNPAMGEGCDAPAECYVANGQGDAGICLESCDLLAPVCSDPREACMGVGSQGWCLKPGELGQGEPCESFMECVAGMICVQMTELDSYCMQACNAELGEGCEGSMSCLDLGIDGRLGICSADCEDECPAEGASRCDEAGGVQSCIYVEGELCLSWGPSSPCPEESFCNPEFGTCEAGGCRVDEDCDNDANMNFYCNPETHGCDLIECENYGGICDEQNPDGVCIGLPMNAPETGVCLNSCDPLEIECGMEGICDWWFVGEEPEPRFVCISAGETQEYEDCSTNRCGWGMVCTPIPEGEEYIYACLYYCDMSVENDCQAEQECAPYEGFLPAGVGICLPVAEG